MLGAVVPDLREAAKQLAVDLRQLSRSALEWRERDRLRADASALLEERTRMQLLVDQRKKDRARSVAALEDEERRAVALAQQATSLKDLIARMEEEIEAAAKAKAEAEAAAARNRELAEATRPAAEIPRQCRPAGARGPLPTPGLAAR
jgi:septal ring factor EnvC (AmiA/AmiB activator)